MPEALYALIPIIAWGTWLAPSHNVHFPNQQVKTLYVTGANLVLALAVLLFQQAGRLSAMSQPSFWLVFTGGVIWTLSGVCAFTATAQIGTARAFGIWAPLNIIVSILWGALLFGEFPSSDTSNLLRLTASLALIIPGVLLIIFAKGRAETRRGGGRIAWLGYAGAIGAGILWGSYFIPVKLADVSMWVGGFPLAFGMFASSVLLVFLARQSHKLSHSSDVLRTLLTGLLWGVGNFGMLLLVDALGAGRGFTIAQLSVVVNALVGIFLLKDPIPGSPSAWRTLFGCVLATLGGILLGNLNY
jgi:glucose uptake protein